VIAASVVYSPTSRVRHAEVDGLRVLLDLNTETYRVLDDVASVLWAVLIGEADAARAFEGLVEHYDVEPARVNADLADFADRCVREALIEHAAPTARHSGAPRRAHGRRAGTLAALLSLVATRYALRRDGFRATYERYAALPAGSDAFPLAAALRGFTRAENFFVARRAPDDCLLRSLSLYRYLRLANVPAEHVIGARRFPFSAHAWVECDGAAVLESRAGDYTPLARIGA
jgi:hypothetical protein